MTRVLVIAAHPDDEVLGAGATMARLAHEGAEVHVAIVTEGCTSQYPDRPDLIEVKRAQAQAALEILGGTALHFGNLPDMQLDTVPLVRVNRFLEEVVRAVAPDVVFTHHAHDLNRDHRIVHEASVVACRPDSRHPVRALYAYDVLGVTNFGGVTPSFAPGVYFESLAFLDRKVRALGAYDIEVRPFPHPRSAEAIEAQGRVYGALSATAWAEAFQVIRDAR
jgi:LmbE family N-acetylglucosaminyl deacetylase